MPIDWGVQIDSQSAHARDSSVKQKNNIYIYIFMVLQSDLLITWFEVTNRPVTGHNWARVRSILTLLSPRHTRWLRAVSMPCPTHWPTRSHWNRRHLPTSDTVTDPPSRRRRCRRCRCTAGMGLGRPRSMSLLPGGSNWEVSLTHP